MTSYKKVNGNLYDDRGIWVVRARVFDPNTGLSRARSKSTGLKVKENTKRKAIDVMKEIVAQWEDEANAAPVLKDPMFNEYVKSWIEKKALALKANTIKTYWDYANIHILPAFDGIKVREMNLKQLQIFYKNLLADHSVSSAKKIHVVISGALLDAVRDGVIQANFADYVEFPKAQKFEGKAYTQEQVARLLETAQEMGEPIHAAIVLAVCYGLRREEICGLRWKDIDFNSNVLHVRNTVTQNGKLRIEVERTKTSKSRRDIALIPSTIPYLKELRASHRASGIASNKVVVFRNGNEVRPDYITRTSGKVMKQSGLEHVRLHDLRHTAASLLAKVATLKQIQEFLGHEDISTTANIYTHLMDEDRRKTSEIMDGILKNSEICSGKCSGSDL